MSFVIQAGVPGTLDKVDHEDRGVEEAMETIFALDSERMILFWFGVPIALGYKYDVSAMIPDLLLLIEDMDSRREGRYEIAWTTNAMQSVWRFEWAGGKCVIDPAWKHVGLGLESILRETGKVVCSSREFVAEWVRPLRITRDALRDSDLYSKMPDFGRIERVLGSYKDEGVLYRDQV